MDVAKLELIAVFTVLLTVAVSTRYRRVCYHTNWSQYRPGIGKFTPGNIDPHLCTHLMYAFAQITNDELATIEWNDEQVYQEFNGLKQQNPALKTILAVGGWKQASTNFTAVVSNAQKMDKFVSTSITFLRRYGFDGLDLDWEYPALRGGSPTDKENFGKLCKKLRQAYEDESLQTGGERLLVTAAVAVSKEIVDAAYDVASMTRYLDFISIMSFDLHGGWDKNTGHNSPLYPRSEEEGDQRFENIDWAAKYWVKLGIPKDQLNIGLATYGRSFLLSDKGDYYIGADVTGPHTPGPYTKEDGYLSYYEICDMISKGGTIYRDNDQLVPYFVNDKTWVGFDDELSIAIKVAWLVQEGYGGAMVWALPLDDFNQVCDSSNRRFPLVSRIKDVLVAAEGIIIPLDSLFQTTASMTMTSPEPMNDNICFGKMNGFYEDPGQCSRFYRCEGGLEYNAGCPSPSMGRSIDPITAVPFDVTMSPGTEFLCRGRLNGDYVDPTDCSKFIKCSNGIAYSFRCVPGTLYDVKKRMCAWENLVVC